MTFSLVEMVAVRDFMLGVIGAGSMGSAILQGALDSGVMLPEQVWLANPHPEKMTPFGITKFKNSL